MLSKVCKPDKFKFYSSSKFSFTNFFFFFFGCESFFESNSFDILALRNDKLRRPSDSSHSSGSGYVFLIWKGSVTLSQPSALLDLGLDFYDFFPNSSLYSAVVFPPWCNYDHVFVSVYIDFWCSFSSHSFWSFLALWDGSPDHLRVVPCEEFYASEFYKWLQVGIEVYIYHRKYQVKPHSFQCFSAACTITIAHKNLFFLLYQ